MGRIRTIKPEFPQSESMGRVSRDARLLFIMLFTIADDAGRARAASRMLASLLFPYDNDAATLISGWLAELQRENKIQCYEVDGNLYLQIVKWGEHQKIDRPSPSRLPAMPPMRKPRERSTKPRETSPQPREASAPYLVPSILDQDQDQDQEDSSSKSPKSDFDGFWNQCPRKIGKGLARKSYVKALTKTDHATLLNAMARYAVSRAGEEQQFTVHPATWLNQERWLDEETHNDRQAKRIVPSANDKFLAGALEYFEEQDERSRTGEGEGAGGDADATVEPLLSPRLLSGPGEEPDR